MEDDDVGSTEYWRDIKQAKQEKRTDNRESSAEYLAQRGIPFVSKNGGAHLVVEGKDCFIDFWPGLANGTAGAAKKASACETWWRSLGRLLTLSCADCAAFRAGPNERCVMP